MANDLRSVWTILLQTPLLWLTLTVAAYVLGLVVQRWCRGNHAVNPAAVAIIALVALLTATDTDYETYFDGARFIHFLLGPATVALVVPLYLNFRRVRRTLVPILAALAVGAPTAALSVVGIAWLFGGTPPILVSLAPKSVTIPIAMGVSEAIGGQPSLTAAAVILSGIVGAMIGYPLLRLCGVRGDKAVGFALGLASHGLGTARAFQISLLAGAFSGIAMGLNGIVTAVVLPVLATLF